MQDYRLIRKILEETAQRGVSQLEPFVQSK
jgi:hypothetical protein